MSDLPYIQTFSQPILTSKLQLGNSSIIVLNIMTAYDGKTKFIARYCRFSNRQEFNKHEGHATVVEMT